LWLDWTPEAMAQLASTVGVLPTWGLQIDISSRVDGHRELSTVLNVLPRPALCQTASGLVHAVTPRGADGGLPRRPAVA
jgi:hypothetical protein